MERLSTFCRVLLFDKAGVGLSDPAPKVRTLDDRAAEIEAVMDAAGFGRAVVFGVSEGGLAAMAFAATRRDRTAALILSGAFAYSASLGGTTSTVTRSSYGHACYQSLVSTTRRRWSSLPASRNSPARVARRGAAVRRSKICCSRSGPCASWQCSSAWARARGWRERRSKRCSGSTYDRSCRRSPRQPWSFMPAATQFRCSRADISPTTSLGLDAELEGTDHAPWLSDPDMITTKIEEFLTGSHAAPAQSHRALRTVLFTDIVASTERDAATGDERWRAVLHRIDEVTATLRNDSVAQS